jgi:drug/metabolite transporter (DMT)-like permease
MNPQEFVLLLLSILPGAFGQFLLKLGASKLGKVTITNSLSYVFSIITVPELLIGLFCYGFGAIAYIMLLSRVKLSIAGPSVALMYVFSVLLGYFAFQEPLPTSRLFGLGFIVCGVILITWQR